LIQTRCGDFNHQGKDVNMVGRISIPALLTAALLSAGCTAAANVESERSALMAADKEWSGTTKDLDKFVSYFAPEASVYGTGMPKISGAGPILAMTKEMMASPGFSLQWTAQRAEVAASGDIGYTVGTYEMNMNNAAGNPMSEKGKYVTVWKKQPDGRWKVTEDIFNSDEPPPPPSAAHTVVASAAMKWGDAPPSVPAGAKMAVVAGDPSKPEPFTLRLQMPANYRIPAHWHPTDERVTVLSGTLSVGMGKTFDQAALKDLPSGGHAVLPATMPHYAMAKNAATIQVDGVGPFVLNYVNPADDPTKK
jgi:ketosteroid isomerase-like protein